MFLPHGQEVELGNIDTRNPQGQVHPYTRKLCLTSYAPGHSAAAPRAIIKKHMLRHLCRGQSQRLDQKGMFTSLALARLC